MASPQSQSQPQPQPNGHAPSPPPPSTTQPQAQPPPEPQLQPAPPQPAAAKTPPNPSVPLTSLTDDGTTKRPRDARLLHLVLSSQGIHSYQERVPLQLLDFAYRYTSGVLGDALRLAGEGYTGTDGPRGGRGRGAGGAGAGGEGEGSIGVTALRQAIASRQGFGFEGGYLPKEFMLEQAAERNRVALPRVERGAGVGAGMGLVLPEEKYCLTGQSWGLKEIWEDEESEDGEGEGGGQREVRMGGMDGVGGERGEEGEGEGDEDEEGAGRMEDVFGEDEGGGGDVDMGGD